MVRLRRPKRLLAVFSCLRARRVRKRSKSPRDVRPRSGRPLRCASWGRASPEAPQTSGAPGVAHPTLVERESIPPPVHVLPTTEHAQQLRCACLSHKREIVESELLEEAAKVATLLHLARDEQVARGRHEAGELNVALLRIIGSGREHVDHPSSVDRMEDPQLPPTLQGLHGNDKSLLSRNRLCRRHPRNAVSAASC